jgi:hypothetical protein
MSKGLLATRIAAALSIAGGAVQTAPPRPATPLEPAAAMVEAFKTHSVVALTAGHGDAVGYAFGLSLARDARFSGIVNDIVIEEGSSRYQDLADRYVRGEIDDISSIRSVWRETTQPGLGLDAPWEAFFRTVREVNALRPPAQRLRVVLGDPPIDWESVKTAADHRRWIVMRDWFPADLIQREVVAKHRRALLFYGQMHFQRKQIAANYESQGEAETIVSRLENNYGARVFTIFTVPDVAKLQPDAVDWPTPSLAIVRGTVLGAADFTFYYPSEAMGRFYIRDGKADFGAGQIPRDQWKTLRAEDQFDAVLVSRARPVPVRPSPARCADKADIQERLRRATLTGIGVDALKQLCGL